MEETADAEAVVAGKRPREDEEVEAGEGSPEAKRIREELLLDILDDESEPDNTDLDSVMRSLEEEICAPLPPPQPASTSASDSEPDLEAHLPDIGFLLAASDDELGLPPAEGDVASGDDPSGVLSTGVEAEAGGFGKIWGLADDGSLDLVFGGERREDNGGDDAGSFFDGGLFDFDGGACGPADFSDLSWRPEFLPAV